MKRIWSLSFVILFLCCGCTKEENRTKLFYGEWKVEEYNQTIVDGITGAASKMEYYLEFNEENCGKKFNANKEETNDIKWAFQEDTTERYLLLSILKNLAPGSYNLGVDEVYFVALLIEDEIKLTRQVVSDDTTHIANRNLILTRE